jgi:site-specific recombinase XerD
MRSIRKGWSVTSDSAKEVRRICPPPSHSEPSIVGVHLKSSHPVSSSMSIETLRINVVVMLLTRFGIRWILQKHVREATCHTPSLKKKRLHPHSWRHSTAVHLLRSGVDLSTIAHLLGHASVNTTNKYLAINLEAKREALTKAKPLMPRK